jgi:hypothetical protein
LPHTTCAEPLAPLAPRLAPEAGESTCPDTPEATPLDPDLARVAAVWPELPEPIRRAILALVESGGGKDGP